jgi:hypothetical protein
LLLVAQKANRFGVVGLMNLLLFLVKKKAQNNRWQRYEIKVFQQIGLKIEAKIVLKQGNYATFVKIINALAEAVGRFRLFANVKSELQNHP